MIVRSLHVRNLKLLRDFQLSFVDNGKPRMWTVIIGENGTAKTTILQAIAMAAAGGVHANTLAEKIAPDLRDRRQQGAMSIEARFGFLKEPRGAGPRPHPPSNGAKDEVLAELSLGKRDTTLWGKSSYVHPGETPRPSYVWTNPLDEVRSRNLPLWFVAGYGVSRVLPDSGHEPRLARPSIDRLKPLFGSETALVSTAFANHFKREKARMFSRVVKAVSLRAKNLLPAIANIELRGPGGVTRAGEFQNSKRITQVIGKQKIKLPATALSHGYQSTLAWIADLAGHIVLEAQNEIRPQDMQGLVLLDELDLYLHPTWQVALVSALRETFPQIQFVATTHSPLVLAGMRPEEIVRLRFADNGDVVRAPIGADARVMTGTEIYREYFGIDDIIPDESGQALRRYRYLGANPFRTDDDVRELARLRKTLDAADIDPELEPVPRTEA